MNKENDCEKEVCNCDGDGCGCVTIKEDNDKCDGCNKDCDHRKDN